MSRRERTKETLERIAELAETALRRHSDNDVTEQDDDDGEPVITCTPRVLPRRLQRDGAELARSINPANAPMVGATEGAFGDVPLDPQRIAVLTSKYWGPAVRRLTVSFMEPTTTALRDKILNHMNAWATRCGISFVSTQGTGQVRISRGGGGYWSYVGTDILLIPKDQPTMNLQEFSLDTSDREYRRVVRHETGHTLGAPHEHMRRALVARIDRDKAYDYFWRTQRWDRRTVDAQVLTPLNEASIMATPADQDSIMCYQLPGSITKNGKPIRGGLDINETDYAFVAKLYPKSGRDQVAQSYEQRRVAQAVNDLTPPQATPDADHDWDRSDDITLDDALHEAEAAV